MIIIVPILRAYMGVYLAYLFPFKRLGGCTQLFTSLRNSSEI